MRLPNLAAKAAARVGTALRAVPNSAGRPTPQLTVTHWVDGSGNPVTWNDAAASVVGWKGRSPTG